MGNYDFDADLKIAHKTENEVALNLTEFLKKKMPVGWKIIPSDSSFEKGYDFELNIQGTIKLIEVKEDFMCKHTGNVAVEFECRGSQSGIQTTKSDYYVYRVHQLNEVVDYLIPVKELNQIIKEKKYNRIVSGGDRGSDSMNYLFSLDEIKNISCII